MWVAARSSPRLFRALAYPLLAISVVGLCLTLIHGVGVTQNGASRWINIGGQQVQPSEIAKLALVLWGADLLARKDRLGQLADWRHLLVPLHARGRRALPARDVGDDLGTTFILLVIFLALLWVIGTAGRVFSGVLILMALAMLLMIVSAKYRLPAPHRLPAAAGQRRPAPTCRASRASTRSAPAAGSASAWAPAGRSGAGCRNATTDFIFAIIGEELGLVGTLCVSALYGGAGLRRAPDRPARAGHVHAARGAAAITAWIVVQAVINIGAVIGVLPDHRGPVAAGVRGAVIAAGHHGGARHADVVRPAEPGAREALAARGPGGPLAS